MAQERAKQVASHTQEDVYEIPVIFHIVHSGDAVGQGNNISREQVIAQMIVLNQDFRRTNPDADDTPSLFKSVATDTKIQFKLAQRDVNGEIMEEPGIHRYEDRARDTWSHSEIQQVLKPTTIWDPNKYLNIWVVPLSNSNDFGYAQFPEQSGLSGVKPLPTDTPETDGVYVNVLNLGSNYTSVGTGFRLTFNYDRGRTLTHEVGHWLGLRHIWGDGGCGQDDFCEDTPTAGRNHDGLGDCSFPGPNTCSSDPRPDMFQNYMDYTNDVCMNLFTQDQKARMRIVLQNSPRRKEVLANANLVLKARQTQTLANTTQLFPNPGLNYTQLQINNELQGEVVVSITDLRGVVLQKNGITKVNKRLQFDLPIQSLPKGIYIVTIQMKHGSIRKRLVKK
ncbi:hypothetical protein BKI52_00565 [marine bacterium AO1-C]|nr:hypothetical protein BKI52_00565 [marine bacterium AO1-C]